ncbi:MAG TPA: reverse transcriptase domain-containing protein, partial [Gemmataceae bacterium]|nr:reverse transcriptase domain-containing protein [Gemmataceae bacterium]
MDCASQRQSRNAGHRGGGQDRSLRGNRRYHPGGGGGYQHPISFNTIPHGPLMRCLSRRIADGSVLSVVKRWLQAPVVERRERGEQRTTAAADTNRGTPQGGVVSPLLANLYFRRFVLAWKQFGHEQRLQARVVNYADDLVICCRPGSGPAALATFRNLITRLGLTVNERKTRLAR